MRSPWGRDKPSPYITRGDPSAYVNRGDPPAAARPDSINRSELSQNRSITYYEVPMTTTASTFTFPTPGSTSYPPTTSPPPVPSTGGGRYGDTSRA